MLRCKTAVLEECLTKQLLFCDFASRTDGSFRYNPAASEERCKAMISSPPGSVSRTALT
jgi:hypothetical protein